VSSAPPVKRLLFPLCLLACGGTAGAVDPASLTPAKNWVAPLFTKQNFRSMTLRGTEARATAFGAINVVDLNLTVFSGDASNRVETVLLSRAATFLPKENLARGDNGVRVIRDDLEAFGVHWVYDHAQKKVSLQGGVRIVFNAEFKNLLK
jgi:hypothetical protein